MSRDMQKLVDEYRATYPFPYKFGPRISITDITQLYEMSNKDAFQMIDNSLLAGFMIGYKYAMNKKHRHRK